MLNELKLRISFLVNVIEAQNEVIKQFRNFHALPPIKNQGQCWSEGHRHCKINHDIYNYVSRKISSRAFIPTDCRPPVQKDVAIDIKRLSKKVDIIQAKFGYPSNLRDKVFIGSDTCVTIEAKTLNTAALKLKAPRRLFRVPLVMMMPRAPRAKKSAKVKQEDGVSEQIHENTPASDTPYDADTDGYYDTADESNCSTDIDDSLSGDATVTEDNQTVPETEVPSQESSYHDNNQITNTVSANDLEADHESQGPHEVFTDVHTTSCGSEAEGGLEVSSLDEGNFRYDGYIDDNIKDSEQLFLAQQCEANCYCYDCVAEGSFEDNGYFEQEIENCCPTSEDTYVVEHDCYDDQSFDPYH